MTDNKQDMRLTAFAHSDRETTCISPNENGGYTLTFERSPVYSDEYSRTTCEIEKQEIAILLYVLEIAKQYEIAIEHQVEVNTMYVTDFFAEKCDTVLTADDLPNLTIADGASIVAALRDGLVEFVMYMTEQKTFVIDARFGSKLTDTVAVMHQTYSDCCDAFRHFVQFIYDVYGFRYL